jgi:hypothetical protein
MRVTVPSGAGGVNRAGGILVQQAVALAFRAAGGDHREMLLYNRDWLPGEARLDHGQGV